MLWAGRTYNLGEALSVKRGYSMALGALVLVGLAAILWWWVPAEEGPAVEGRRVKVQAGPLRRLVVSTGTVKPQVGAEVKVGARISGRVERLMVAVGQRVRAGQVVAEIEHQDLMARMAQARAERRAAEGRVQRIEATGPRELSQAQAEVAEVDAQLDQARLEHSRQKSLASKAAVSQQAMERTLRELRVLQARHKAARARLLRLEVALKEDLAVARAELAAARAREDTARINLGYATVRAPISGVVSSVSTQEGETVSASLNAPTFITIVDLDRLQVDDYVDETDVGRIKVGQKAFFTVDAFPGRPFAGKVAAVHPSAQLIDNVVYYTTVIDIEGDYSGQLKPEMTASVSIVVDRKKSALWVPSAAVRLKSGRHLVYLDQDGAVRPVPVKVGWSEPGRTEILQGLKEGQTVVVTSAAATATQLR